MGTQSDLFKIQRLALFLVCVFLLLEGGAALPQETSREVIPGSRPSIKAVPFLINSVSRKDQAWAAYLIGQNGLISYVPRLLQLLVPTDPQQAPTKEVVEGRALDRVILDALIKLKAIAPGDRLMPLFSEFPDEILIVLSASPEVNQKTLLSLAEGDLPDTRWLAVCNLLASIRAEGFAARLLQDLTIKVSLFVSEDGLAGGGEGGGSGGIGCGVLGMPQDFPPTTIYEVTDQFQDGDVLLADGPHRIYYRRHAVPMNQQIGIGTEFSMNDRDVWRKEYIALLLEEDPQLLAFDPRPSYGIRWIDSKALEEEAKKIRELQYQSFQELTSQLWQKGLVGAEEAGALKPRISFVVYDRRRNREIPVHIPRTAQEP